MLRVIKGNKELRIEDSELPSFLEQGYSAIDGNGNILKVGKATSFEEIVKENSLLKKEHLKLTKLLNDADAKAAGLERKLAEAVDASKYNRQDSSGEVTEGEEPTSPKREPKKK